MDLAAAFRDEGEIKITQKSFATGQEKVVDAEFIPPSGLSLEAVKPSFLQYIGEVDKMVAQANEIIIKDDDSLKFAVALGGQAKKIVKLIEAKEEEVTREAKDFTKSVSSFVKMFTEKLVANTKKTNTGSVEIVLKAKITDYQTKQEMARREAEAKAKAAAEELQKKLNAEAEEKNRIAREEAIRKAEEEARAKAASEAEIEAARKKAEEEAKKKEIEAPTVTAPVIPVNENVVRTETGSSAHQSKRWVCEITDASLVPREFCEPVMKLLNDAVKMGIREIPGCIIKEVSDTRFRA